MGNAAIDLNFSGREQRIDPRRQARWIVEGTLSSGIKFRVQSINISQSGLLLQMPSSVNIGERAYIKVFAMINGAKKTIDAVVEIMHETLSKNKFQCGVKFLKISKDNSLLFSSYVKNKNSLVVVDNREDSIIKSPITYCDKSASDTSFLNSPDKLKIEGIDVENLNEDLEEKSELSIVIV